jgi:VanZ family protein
MGPVSSHGEFLRRTHRKLSAAGKQLRIVWLLGILVVIVGSLLPASSPAMRALDRLPVSDKMEHTAAYAFLVFVPAIHERRKLVMAAAAGAILLGVALEFAQLLSGWRDFEFADMVADAVGVGTGLAAGWAIRGYAAPGITARSGIAERIRKQPGHRPAGPA